MKAKVSVLPGVAGIKSVYELTLKEKEVGFICTSSNYDELLKGWYEKDFAPRLETSGVKVREILGGKGGIESESEGDVVIASEWVALVSFEVESPFAVMIEDKELVKGFAERFEALWQGLGR